MQLSIAPFHPLFDVRMETMRVAAMRCEINELRKDITNVSITDAQRARIERQQKMFNESVNELYEEEDENVLGLCLEYLELAHIRYKRILLKILGRPLPLLL